ncbi:hypothetical protein OROGR_031652 [Orobanche gracilis]
MDFDEYEYLENTVENPELKKSKDKVNEGEGILEPKEKDRNRMNHKSDDYGDDLDRPSKYPRSRKESGVHGKDRSDYDDDAFDRPSKGLRSMKESNDHEQDRRMRNGQSSRGREKAEKDKHTSSREHRMRDKEDGSGKKRNRDRDRDKDAERDSDKKREGNRGRRELDYERERNSDREEGDRDAERDSDKKREGNRERRERDYVRERNRDMEEGERSKRSRSHLERHQEEQGREKSREISSMDKDIKEGRREREFRGRDHDSRRFKEKKEDAVEPEADPERDQRTVFAYQVSELHNTLKAGERDVYEFFSRVGKVRDVQLIMDRNTRRSKGVGYIEFYDAMSVPMAIALSGQPLMGQPVMVKPSEAEKNLVQPTPAVSVGGLGPYSGGARKLYVGNLPVTIKEDQLREVFEAFGTIELIQMPTDPGTSNCKGFAFIQYATLEAAKTAQNVNGQLEIAGRSIKVSAVTDQAGMQDAGANIADFDDDEGNGLSLNAHSRALLMQKLDRSGTASSIGSSVPFLGQTPVPLLPGLAAATLSMPALTIPPEFVGVPSECLLLKNMFDPNAEAEPDFDLDIKEDCEGECSKYGRLKHIYVEKNTAGFVYLRFERTDSAINAQRSLHGRWFAGKMITATFMLPQDYEAKFPDSI